MVRRNYFSGARGRASSSQSLSTIVFRDFEMQLPNLERHSSSQGLASRQDWWMDKTYTLGKGQIRLGQLL